MLDNETLFSLLAKGGIMQLLIGISSVAAIAIIIERFLTYSKFNRETKRFTEKLGKILETGNLARALEFAERDRAAVANVVKLGIKNFSLGKERVSETMENAAKQVLFELEKGLSALATISGVAPLLGFLGTVTGMISAFMQIQNLEGVANPTDLAGGIWEALITTASGLAVGIVALTAYNFFVARVKKIALDMETIATEIINKIAENENE